jgi:hypothetical protein
VGRFFQKQDDPDTLFAVHAMCMMHDAGSRVIRLVYGVTERLGG